MPPGAQEKARCFCRGSSPHEEAAKVCVEQDASGH